MWISIPQWNMITPSEISIFDMYAGVIFDDVSRKIKDLWLSWEGLELNSQVFSLFCEYSDLINSINYQYLDTWRTFHMWNINGIKKYIQCNVNCWIYMKDEDVYVQPNIDRNAREKILLDDILPAYFNSFSPERK